MTTRAKQIELLLDPLIDPTTGGLCSGYTVYFYAAGTSTPKNVWTEKEKTNPYTSYSLDSAGKVLLYGDGIYKIVIKNAAAAAVLTLNDIKIQANNYSVATKSGVYTATPDDDCLLCDGTWTLSLDPVANFLHPLEILNNGAGTITIDPDGSEQIGGSATLDLGAGERVRIIPDATSNSWFWVDFISDVAAHAAATGTAVHGLGTMCTQNTATISAPFIPDTDNAYAFGQLSPSNKRWSYIIGVLGYLTNLYLWNGSSHIKQGQDMTAALHRKIVNIGDWDMDASSNVDVAHGLTMSKIRSVSGMVRNDADTLYSPITPGRNSPVNALDVYAAYVDATNVHLIRLSGGFHDTTDYNATSYNRGYLVIEYVD